MCRDWSFVAAVDCLCCRMTEVKTIGSTAAMGTVRAVAGRELWAAAEEKRVLKILNAKLTLQWTYLTASPALFFLRQHLFKALM